MEPIQTTRFSSGRMFSVQGEGWYIYTREGVKGPFFERSRAESFLEKLKAASYERREQLW